VLGAGPAQICPLAAARRSGLVVVAADRDPAAPGFRYAHRRALVSIEDEPALDRLARAERVDAVAAPGSDRTPAVAARIAEKLGLPHSVDVATAHRLAARHREREALAAAGFSLPRAIVAQSLAEAAAAAAAVGFPCSVTAADRPAGSSVVATSPSTLPHAVAAAAADSRAGALLVEETGAGPVLVVVGFAVAGALQALLTIEETDDGLIWPATASPGAIEAALAQAARATAVVGVGSGPVEIRLAARADEVTLVSVAARLGRNHEAELCRVAVGVDLNALALQSALGDSVARVELAPHPRVAAACIRLLPAAQTVAGLETAFAVPGVAGIRTYHGRERGGAILATGADRDEAVAAAERAASVLRFESMHAKAVA
jgi:formate-dependent phosphoribosylglycinamide formyltransferase (GAR transformylase)